MTSPEQTSKRRARHASRRERVVKAVLLAALAILVFLVGVAFSRALDERPRTGDPVTTVQTFGPREQEAPERTVTVTVTGP